jgi:hypothetical protein
VRAIEKEEAGGERFIGSAGGWSWQEMRMLHPSILHSEFHRLHILAVVDALRSDPSFAPSIPAGSPGIFKKDRSYGNGEKTVRVLGVPFRSLKDSARDTVEALRKRGWAENK